MGFRGENGAVPIAEQDPLGVVGLAALLAVVVLLLFIIIVLLLLLPFAVHLSVVVVVVVVVLVAVVVDGLAFLDLALDRLRGSTPLPDLISVRVSIRREIALEKKRKELNRVHQRRNLVQPDQSKVTTGSDHP